MGVEETGQYSAIMGGIHDGTHTCVVRIEDGGVSSINESNSVDNAIDVRSVHRNHG